MEDKKLHTVTITERKSVCITGVKEVENATTEKLNLLLVSGVRLSVLGVNLKINSFSVDSGVCSANGKIDNVKYAGEKMSILKRLTK